MAHWVEGDAGYANGRRASYVNLDAMSSIWAETVSGVTYVKCLDANGVTHTLADAWTNYADALDALECLMTESVANDHGADEPTSMPLPTRGTYPEDPFDQAA